ncbi:hypothetical protein ABZ930_15475 [Streptomyces sp. NPDC046716]|uniref:hypothetical protein n=1 Tax=Streptomyces sp. NPDC046716 TaxID=3157093 RepID=UPI0033C71278
MDPVTAVAAASVALVAKGALESAAQEAGRAGWAGGARLLERLRARFRGDHAAEAALEGVTRAPDDEGALAHLERLLAAHMLRDHAFEAELRRVVAEAEAARTKGSQVSAGVIKNATVFNEKVEIQGDWNIS